jgi:hypothetical protein
MNCSGDVGYPSTSVAHGMRTLVHVLLAAAFIKMLSRQLYVKVTKLSRASRTLRDASGRLPKTWAFLVDRCRYDVQLIRRCRRCLDQLAAARIREVTLFGVGDVAEVLYCLTLEVPVKIVAVYDDVAVDEAPSETFFRYPIQPPALCRSRDHKVIVAALVGVEDKLEKLRQAGIRSDRIVVIA